MTSERLFNSFIPPPPKKNFYTPQKQISGYAPDRGLASEFFYRVSPWGVARNLFWGGIKVFWGKNKTSILIVEYVQ